MKDKLIDDAVKALKDKGHRNVSKDNILREKETRLLFRAMLQENLGKVNRCSEMELLAEIEDLEQAER